MARQMDVLDSIDICPHTDSLVSYRMVDSIYQEFENLRIIIVKKELFGIPRRKRLELCGLKRKWLAISSQIPDNSTKLLKEKFSNS